MTPLRIANILHAELTASVGQKRIPESDLIVTDQEAVEAFASAGNGEGIMAPLYQYTAEQIAKALPASGTVVDLGCGSGELLLELASQFPGLQFVGVDLSETMLTTARQRSRQRGLPNVSFIKEDFCHLRSLAHKSIDFVYCSVALHHLPALEQLCNVMLEINRVLTLPGGLYLVDFGRLRSARSVRLFTDDAAHHAPPVLIRDYEASLRAAFSVDEWRLALRGLAARQPQLMSTFGAPFLVSAAIQHPTSSGLIPRTLRGLRKRLTFGYYVDYMSIKLTVRKIKS